MEKRYDYITPNDYEKAELNGISTRLLEQRVRSFLWDVDKAVNTPKKKRRCFKKNWGRWQEIAIENGIDRDTFTNRVRSLGWDEEAAAITPKGTRRSKWSPEEISMAERNGVAHNHMSVVNMRINKLGWTREEALNTPRVSEEERLKRVVAGTRKYNKGLKVGNN